MQVGDHIVKIDGVDCIDWSMKQASRPWSEAPCCIRWSRNKANKLKPDLWKVQALTSNALRGAWCGIHLR